MADVILNILQWAIPSGGIGAAIAWVANRKAHEARNAKEVHDTYKAMYLDISNELIVTQKKLDENTKMYEELTNEHSRTRRALNRLSRAIEAIQLCPHRANCPVSGELSLDEDDAEQRPARRGKGHRKDEPHGDGEPKDGDASGNG